MKISDVSLRKDPSKGRGNGKNIGEEGRVDDNKRGNSDESEKGGLILTKKGYAMQGKENDIKK